ncbi:O-methyltransferase [Fimbriiglobus ruber]|uniref:O-methyltransferase n=1 Tax=Fimbriiglobus ruber TaxID=1908690 RepID=A0A225E123_9BACT|nr:class I SAM-dependent methyltransferase [Fimbriiglobus ruber]OWK43726.1 O-methyltransferase [Fimbriiglobus ruber]
MLSTLQSEPVRLLLDRLFRAADENDPGVFARVSNNFDRLKGTGVDSQVADVLKDAYMPVSPDAGRFLYQLARARPDQLVVEFGMSFGLSTIHLAAGVRDAGRGRVVTTEMEPAKVRQATEHLREAGLLDRVEILAGDARETLAGLTGEIDLVLLDGWKDLYLPVLKLLEPRLRTGAFVVADDLDVMPVALRPYLEYVRDPANGYVSVEIPLGDRLEFSQWIK